MTETERLTILYGDPALAPPERIPLCAGPLTLVYTTAGDLRYIKWGKHEIMRRLYPAVRDDKWGTISATITETERTIGEDSFHIAYDGHYADAAKNIDFLARVTLTGDATGAITFDFDGEARSAFSRNRIGICALHPAQDCKGKSCVVRHTNGSEEEGAFPALIAPHQPFFDIAAITHEVAPGVSVMVAFEGDVFEIEDQRNWLDASFKTYSTPLALPFPVEIPAGTRIHQTVTLTVSGENAAALPYIEANAPIVCTVGDEVIGELPGIGLHLTKDQCPLSKEVEAKLFALSPGHVRIDVDFTRPGYEDFLAYATNCVEQIRQHPKRNYSEGWDLHIGILNADKLPPPKPFDPICSRPPVLLHCFLFPLTADGVKWVGETATPSYGGHIVMSHYYFPVLSGGGSNTNFTELNREHTVFSKSGVYPMAIFAANPQVHALDSLSIMETPPMLADATRTAKSFDAIDYGSDKPRRLVLWLGPLTLYGPYQRNDARQRSLFGAAWYLAAYSYATEGKVEEITLCEIAGAHGIMSADGVPYPVLEVIRKLGETGGKQVIRTSVSDPLKVACLAIELDSSLTVFAVNLTPDRQDVTVEGLRSRKVSRKTMDETTQGVFLPDKNIASQGESATFTLLPYAIAEITVAMVNSPFPRVVEDYRNIRI